VVGVGILVARENTTHLAGAVLCVCEGVSLLEQSKITKKN